MTCIVGVTHNSHVYLAGDSAGVAGWDLTVRADAKVFRNGPYVMGFTSSFRMGQLLRYALTPPEPVVGDLDRFMVTTFIDAVRDCLKAGGYATRQNEVESGGNFLVGIHGRLFEVQSDYQVGEPADRYASVGCGENIAKGSLHSTEHLALEPHQRLTMALQAAEHLSGGVRGPYAYVSTEDH
jgi:ATP-dependent protease HslVU (ClpYQ) peptidase subunit